MTPEGLSQRIVGDCRSLGFHRVGIVPVEPAARHDVYRSWLNAGHAGEMAYLSRVDHVEGRRDPREALPQACTVVVVALSYGGPDLVPAGSLLRGRIARYARGEDYHVTLRRKLVALAEGLADAVPRPILWRACVDTAPLLERDLAERAGIGFVAKNTMLIAPGLGSYVVLGELLLDVEVATTAEEPGQKRCGSCRACLDACPTGAFADAYVLDARRCISYLTIELEGPIPRALRPKLGTMIFGCDICQEVCPFNAAAKEGAPELRSGAWSAPELIAILALGAAQFRRFVKNRALRRVRRHQLLRNACVALGNTGSPHALLPLRQALLDRHPLVRGHAAWGLGRLGDASVLCERLALETESAVREEIEWALQEMS